MVVSIGVDEVDHFRQWGLTFFSLLCWINCSWVWSKYLFLLPIVVTGLVTPCCNIVVVVVVVVVCVCVCVCVCAYTCYVPL